MKCPYCASEVVLKDSKIIYGKSYGNVWICSNYPKCDAFVSCHKGTDRPLGMLANSELRNMRKLTHSAFDSLWQEAKKRGIKNARSNYYRLLAKELGISEDECH